METINLEMTEELKQKLEGYLAITPDQNFPYVPKIFRTTINLKKNWPVFTLRALDAEDLADMEDNSGYTVWDTKHPSKREFHGMSGSQRLSILKAGVVGWKNFVDDKGKKIEYKDQSSIKILPKPLQVELINAITEQLHLSEEELRGLE